MKNRKKFSCYFILFFVIFLIGCSPEKTDQQMIVNDMEYLEKPGLTVMAFDDNYPMGKQGGIVIIHHGERIASNGFIRMQPVDGTRIPEPLGAVREIDSVNQMIRSVVS